MDKMRLFVSVIATTAIFFVASVAGAAATFSATATPSANTILTLVPSDTVTIDITMLSDGSSVFGLGVSAVGYDPAVASFASGSIPANVLNAICVGPGTCFGGLANATTTAAESSLNVPGLPEVQLFNGVAVVAVTGTGAADQGVITGVAGDAQFQIVFTAVAAGTTSITIGANAAYGDEILGTGGVAAAATNAVVTLTVIPEPGTALLMGLGLAGLASAGRRN
jgi:hypothetical protein